MNRRQLVWLGGGTAVLMVAVGVAINQVLNNGVWSWPWFGGAVALAVASGVAGRRIALQDQAKPILRHEVVDTKGHPLLVGQVIPRQFGVHPSRFGRQGDSPYIARDIDQALAAALHDEEQRLIVVQGPRLSGATSTLAQAAQSELSDHYLLVFAHDPRFTVTQMVAEGSRWAAQPAGAVLWLDDLTPNQLEQLDSALLKSLPAGLWILATAHDKLLRGFRVPEHVAQLLEERAVCLTLGTLSEQERDAIRGEEVYASLRAILDTDADLLMGRLMVALDQIQAALLLGSGEESTEHVAVLRAVTDWYRAAMPTALSRASLEVLYSEYRREITGLARPSRSSTLFDRALNWATSKASRQRPQLVYEEKKARSAHYVAHPLLGVVADDVGQPGSWPVSDALWEYADRHLEGAQRCDIGYEAVDRNAYSYAFRLLGHDDADVYPRALLPVARWLLNSGKISDVRRWLIRIIETGHPDAAPVGMFYLGLMEYELGNAEQARRRWKEAIDTGEPYIAPLTLFHLGQLEADQDNIEEARALYFKAIASRHRDSAPKAMVHLANLEYEQGNVKRARRWLTKVIDANRPDSAPKAMFNMAILEDSQGNIKEARRWFTKAIDTDYPETAPDAMVCLGRLEYEQGNIKGARRRLTRAIDTGHPDAAPEAMMVLGYLEYMRGNVGVARRRWEEAIATGHPDSAPDGMFHLGYLEYELGNLVGARHWYDKTIATGHPDSAPKATVHLGILEYDRGNPAGARYRWREAITHDRPDSAPQAMINLGILEVEQGNIGEARRWYGEAATTDNSYIASEAKSALRDLDRRQQERDKAEHFDRYGWQVYADPALMKPRRRRHDLKKPSDDDQQLAGQ